MCDGGIFLDELSDYQHLKYSYSPGSHRDFVTLCSVKALIDEFLTTGFYEHRD
jgi:hypothetical protein